MFNLSLPSTYTITLKYIINPLKRLKTMLLTELECEYTLSELYNLTQIEQERQLTKEEREDYIKYYDLLILNNVEIPFAVEI